MAGRGRGRGSLRKLLEMPVDEEQEAIDAFEGMDSKPLGMETFYPRPRVPRKKYNKPKTINKSNKSFSGKISENMMSDADLEALAAVTSITPIEPSFTSPTNDIEFAIPALPSLIDVPYRNRQPPRRAATLAAAAVAATVAQEQADNDPMQKNDINEPVAEFNGNNNIALDILSRGRKRKGDADVEDSEADMPPRRRYRNRGPSRELEQETMPERAEKMSPLVGNNLKPTKQATANINSDLIRLINSSSIFGGVRHWLGVPSHEAQVEFNGISTPFVLQRPSILKRGNHNMAPPKPLEWPESLEFDIEHFSEHLPEVPPPIEHHIIDEIYSKALFGANTPMIMSDDSKRWKRIKEHWRQHYRRRAGIETTTEAEEEEVVNAN